MCLLLPPVASAPTSVMAVQEGPTSIRVSWSPPTPLGDTTGYRIYYSGGSGGSTSQPVSGSSTNNYRLDNLLNSEQLSVLQLRLCEIYCTRNTMGYMYSDYDGLKMYHAP